MANNNTSPRFQRLKNIRDQVKLQSQFGTSQIRSGLLQLRSTVPGVPIVRERINKLRVRMGRPPVGESPAQQPEMAAPPPTFTAPAGNGATPGTFDTTPASVLGGQAATTVSGQASVTQSALNTTVQSMLGGGF